MLNSTLIMANAFGDQMETNYRQMFGSSEPAYAELLNTAGRLTIEIIATSDALYHNAEHTMLVTLVGQEIYRGRHLRERVTPQDWLHYTLALLCHDIGYVRGVCSGDTQQSFVVDAEGNRFTPSRGASDASLTPYHVERGKIFVRERLGQNSEFDVERISRAIELTRFPVPDNEDHSETKSEAGLVRAADLIGQMADPRYLQKLTNLYHEFVETGAAEKLGYESAADLADGYPKFYWNVVEPYIEDAIQYLQLTQEGKQWVANLHSIVFAIEHGQNAFGPFRETDAD